MKNANATDGNGDERHKKVVGLITRHKIVDEKWDEEKLSRSGKMQNLKAKDGFSR
jgi:hypothetical protein